MNRLLVVVSTEHQVYAQLSEGTERALGVGQTMTLREHLRNTLRGSPRRSVRIARTRYSLEGGAG